MKHEYTLELKDDQGNSIEFWKIEAELNTPVGNILAQIPGFDLVEIIVDHLKGNTIDTQ